MFNLHHEQNVHVIDFAGPAAQPCQWVQLLRDFHSRPEGAPHLRLTIVHDDGEFLAKVSESLADEADELDVPFQVHCVAGQIETLDPNDLHGVLGLKSGEARAIVCTTRLHRLLAAADDAASSSSLSSVGHHSNQMAASIARLQQMAASGSGPATIRGAACEDDDGDGGDPYRSPATPLGFVSPPLTTPPFQMPAALAGFLSAARAAAPEIVVLAEQEAGHNGASFRKRFAEALRYYAAAYDSLDAAAARRGAGGGGARGAGRGGPGRAPAGGRPPARAARPAAAVGSAHGGRRVPRRAAEPRRAEAGGGRAGEVRRGGMREQRARGMPAPVLEVVASLLGLGMAPGHRLGLWGRQRLSSVTVRSSS